MLRHSVCVVLLLALAGVVSAEDRSGEVEIDTFLRDWEEHSSNWQCFDADFTCWSVNLDDMALMRGRIYFEAADRCRLEVEPLSPAVETAEWGPRSYRMVPGDAQAMVWNENGVMLLHTKEKVALRCTREQLRSIRDYHRDVKTMPFWKRLRETYSLMWSLALYVPECPQEIMPFVAGIDHGIVKRDYEISVRRREEGFWVIAKPQSNDGPWCAEQVQLILDPQTYLPRKLWLLKDQAGTGDRGYVFHDVRVNQKPKDRDSLLVPDLKGYREMFSSPPATETTE